MIDKFYDVQSGELVDKLACVLGYESTDQLYQRHTLALVDLLKQEHTMWTKHSVDRIIFDTLLINSGKILIEVVPHTYMY